KVSCVSTWMEASGYSISDWSLRNIVLLTMRIRREGKRGPFLGAVRRHMNALTIRILELLKSRRRTIYRHIFRNGRFDSFFYADAQVNRIGAFCRIFTQPVHWVAERLYVGLGKNVAGHNVVPNTDECRIWHHQGSGENASPLSSAAISRGLGSALVGR